MHERRGDHGIVSSFTDVGERIRSMLVDQVSKTGIAGLRLVLRVVAQGAAAAADGDEGVRKESIVAEEGGSRGLVVPSSRW